MCLCVCVGEGVYVCVEREDESPYGRYFIWIRPVMRRPERRRVADPYASNPPFCAALFHN